ncbi:hypothetical protein CF640_37645, partial [Burkholderia pseudomallei]
MTTPADPAARAPHAQRAGRGLRARLARDLWRALRPSPPPVLAAPALLVPAQPAALALPRLPRALVAALGCAAAPPVALRGT